MKISSSGNRSSDQSGWVSTHRLSNKEAYTERVDFSTKYILLSKTFITSAILVAMISLKNYLNICCRNEWEN